MQLIGPVMALLSRGIETSVATTKPTIKGLMYVMSVVAQSLHVCVVLKLKSEGARLGCCSRHQARLKTSNPYTNNDHFALIGCDGLYVIF
ncbi:hypothetical protein TNCV_2323261 [Trichonephila clavipes]|nr:hypothetical protein TNCV_2323261 [Trichonephila clavipes]